MDEDPEPVRCQQSRYLCNVQRTPTSMQPDTTADMTSQHTFLRP